MTTPSPQVWVPSDEVGPTAIYDACEDLLQVAREAVIQTPGGEIARAFVSPGAPALDCLPQLTVHTNGPSQANTAPLLPWLQPGRRAQRGHIVNLMTLVVTVARCVAVAGGPTGRSFPPTADQEQGALETMSDVWTIWNAIVTRKLDDTLFPPFARSLFIDPAIPLRTSGGAAGWEIHVRVEIGGFRTVETSLGDEEPEG